jgi:hypothetical protein
MAIGGYCWLLYCKPLVVILLLAIDDYFLLVPNLLMVIGGYSIDGYFIVGYFKLFFINYYR